MAGRTDPPTSRVRGTLALVVASLLALTACGGSTGPTTQPEPSHPEPSHPATTSRPAAPSKVLVVIEENHTLDQMRSGMPYAASLADEYGYATRWTALAHPSEPNYLAIVGGSTYGVTDDRTPAANAAKVGNARSVFGQALAAGKTARTYAESMPRNCHVADFPDRAGGAPRYVVRHNPWVYFGAERAQCLQHDTDLSTFATDAASNRLPNVGFLIPDLLHDAHDGSLAAADAWLERQLAPVLSSDDFTRGRLAVVITADEDDRSRDNTVLTAVLHVRLSHKVVATPLTHYSLTRFLAEVLGVEPLGAGRDAPDLRRAFGL